MNISVETRLVDKLGLKSALMLTKLFNEGFYDGNFVEVGEEFYKKINMSEFQFRKVRDFCKVLNLVEITRNGKPNRTKLSLNLARYNEIIESEQDDYGIKP